MVTNVKVKQGSIESHYQRLNNIKTLLDSQGGHNSLSLAKICKGSSCIYTILSDNKIVIPTPDGLTWNTKIPLTRKLAETIKDKTREYHIISKAKYFANKGKGQTISTNVTKNTLKSNNQIKTNKRKSKTPVTSTTKKGSILWGLITWEYKQ